MILHEDQAWLAVAEAWPGVLAGGRDKLTLTRLGAHLRRTWEEFTGNFRRVE